MKDATPHSNSYGFCAISGAQFFHNVLDMTLDCIFRNRQQTSDFTVSVSSGNFLQDLYLALAERFLAQVLRQACCNFRWNMLSSAVNLADCLDELLARHALEHVSLGAGLQRAMNLGVAFKRGEHDHPSAWKVRAYQPLWRGLAPANSRGCRFQVIENAHGGFVKVAARFGQGNRTRSAQQQFRAEVIFKRGYLFADRWLAKAALLGDGGEASLLDNPDKRMHRFESVHGFFYSSMECILDAFPASANRQDGG